MRVARAGRGLGMILHREYRPAFELDAAIGAIEKRDMGLGCALWQGRLIHREAVVHRGDFNHSGGLVLDRMIGAMMALMHLRSLGADREPEHLMTEANSKSRRAGVDNLFNHGHRVLAGLGGIAGAVRKEHAVRLHRQYILSLCGRRHYSYLAAFAGGQPQDVTLDALMDRDQVEFRPGLPAVAFSPRSRR